MKDAASCCKNSTDTTLPTTSGKMACESCRATPSSFSLHAENAIFWLSAPLDWEFYEMHGGQAKSTAALLCFLRLYNCLHLSLAAKQLHEKLLVMSSKCGYQTHNNGTWPGILQYDNTIYVMFKSRDPKVPPVSDKTHVCRVKFQVHKINSCTSLSLVVS